MLYKTCPFIQNLADPLTQDTFDDIRYRLEKCRHVSSNHICCENNSPSTPPTQTTAKPVGNRNQNQKLENFNTDNCGIALSNRISYGT